MMSGSPSLTRSVKRAGRFSRNEVTPSRRRPTGRGRACRGSRRGGRASGARRRASSTASAARARPTPGAVFSTISRASAARRVEQLGGGVQAAQEPALEPLLRGEHPARGHPLHRAADADDARQEPARAASGTMPRRANTKPMRASSEARRMSIGSVIVAPTPTAGPLIAAITGLVEANTRSVNWPPLSRGTAPGGSGARGSRRSRRRRPGRRRRRSRGRRR